MDLRILVTGHNGYIGCVMVPMLRSAGHEVVGLDSNLFRGLRSIPDNLDFPEVQLDIRDVQPKHLSGFRGGHSSRGPLQRRAQRPKSRSDLRNQPRCFGSSGGALEERRCRAISLLFFPCAIYGKAGDDLVAETGAVEAITPYTISKDRSNEVAKLASDEFSPRFSITRRRMASAMPQFDLVRNNLVASAYAAGRVLSRATARRGDAPFTSKRLERILAALEAPREAIHNQAFNVGQPEETTALASWPRSSGRWSPARASSTRKAAAPTAGPTGSL